jgi:CCR4-NOT transcription complex subunit 2
MDFPQMHWAVWLSGVVEDGNPSFDLNDFPSLGGGGGNASSTLGGNDGLAAALRQQQLLQQQMLSGTNTGNDKSSNLYRLAMGGLTNGSSTFKVENEDFPALGSPNSNSGGGGAGSGLTVGGGDGAADGSVGLGGVVGGGSTSLIDSGLAGVGSVGGNSLDYTGLVGGGNQSSQTRSNATTTQQQPGSSSGSTGTAGSAIGGDYGLLGLLSVIRMTDADRNRLALGSDLTVLGLNLNSNDNLYSTFGGPFSDQPATREPHYQVRKMLIFQRFYALIECFLF